MLLPPVKIPKLSLAPDRVASLVDEAARCVACGLCLPHCPTYRKTRSEADSPRGRIMLMQGVLEGRLPLNERFLAHIDLCLTCRACENVCPNKVRYGKLANRVRAMAEPARRRSAWGRVVRGVLLNQVVPRPLILRLGGRALRLWQGSALRSVVHRLGVLKFLGVDGIEALAPAVPPLRHWRASYSAPGVARGDVGLFLGCVARITDGETLSAAIFVLNRLGYNVHVPPAQTCCGAMHQGLREMAQAEALARRNVDAFGGRRLDAVVFTATGCGAVLGEYPGFGGGPLVGRIAEICEFLASAPGWEGVDVRPLPVRIAVHEPCSARNVLHCEEASYALLRRIPEAAIIPLAGNDQCCGAGGVYFLTQPEMAGLLRDDKIAAIAASGADFISTTNPGCAAHMVAGLRAAGARAEVVHPVTLLARQMGFEDGEPG